MIVLLQKNLPLQIQSRLLTGVQGFTSFSSHQTDVPFLEMMIGFSGFDSIILVMHFTAALYSFSLDNLQSSSHWLPAPTAQTFDCRH